jgi:hypothetical protein
MERGGSLLAVFLLLLQSKSLTLKMGATLLFEEFFAIYQIIRQHNPEHSYLLYSKRYILYRAAVAQSALQLATSWTIERPGSSSGRIKNFHFSVSSRPALGPT